MLTINEIRLLQELYRDPEIWANLTRMAHIGYEVAASMTEEETERWEHWEASEIRRELEEIMLDIAIYESPGLDLAKEINLDRVHTLLTPRDYWMREDFRKIEELLKAHLPAREVVMRQAEIEAAIEPEPVPVGAAQR